MGGRGRGSRLVDICLLYLLRRLLLLWGVFTFLELDLIKVAKEFFAGVVSWK
jgi:hypothetical protein